MVAMTAQKAKGTEAELTNDEYAAIAASRSMTAQTIASHAVGMVGEGHFIAWASAQGWDIYRGLDGHTRCDYVVDTGEALLRVEVKRIISEQSTARNYYYVTCTKLNRARFDFLFVSTPHGCYWIPASDCPTRTLSVKVTGEYQRNITRPGKWESYRVQPI